MKMKKGLLPVVAAIVLLAAASAAAVFILNGATDSSDGKEGAGNPAASVIPNDQMSSMVSAILEDVSFDPNFSYGPEDPVYFGYDQKYPFGTYEEGMALTVEQLEEDIAYLQEQYLAYLKTCKSEYLKEQAQMMYDSGIRRLEYMINLRRQTPEQSKKLDEKAFYVWYERCKERNADPERHGKSPEETQRMLEIAERAKRYYEEGVITIEQACQAVGLTSANLPYDPTFSLPD